MYAQYIHQKPNTMPAIKSHNAVVSTMKPIDYPAIGSPRRKTFLTKANKPLTDFAYRVYDLISTIPKGRVTTYGIISKKLDSSPRAVGNALRSNPFAPIVPCHRIIATTGFIGGFQGQWGNAEPNCITKRALLHSEGVDFDDKGFILDKGLVYHW